MIKTLRKGSGEILAANFNSNEFDCKGNGCCNSTKIDTTLISLLQKLREHFGKSVRINSGFRCEKHNAAVGGTSGSHHKTGQAADIVKLFHGQTYSLIAQDFNGIDRYVKIIM